MPLVLKDRVKETTTTTGTGTVTLAGTTAGFSAFSVIGNANTTYYAIVSQTPGEWEVGIGTYTSSGTTLSRDTVLESSNSGSLVNFSAGSKDVFVTYPGEYAVASSNGLGTSGQVLTSNGPNTTPTFQAASGGGGAITISNKTGAYTVVAGDLGTIINCSGATSFTVSLTAAATLGSGFNVTIWNNTTTAAMVVTIDPNASETIDGSSSLQLRRGEGMQIVCDGTNWQSGDKKRMRAYAENVGAGQSSPTVAGNLAVGIGIGGVSAAGEASLALGYIATALAATSTAIGANSSYQGAQVASAGSGAMALGGSYASGVDSFAAGVGSNSSSFGARGSNSIAIGANANTNATYGTVLGGFGNNATASWGIALGGRSCTAGFNYSIALGYLGVTNAVGKITFGHAGGPIGLGGLGWGKLNLYVQTTTATPAVLTSDASAAGSTNQLIVPNNSAYAFTGTVVARRQASGGTESAAWKVEGLIRREGTAGTTTLVASTVTAISNVPGWTLALSADTTNGSLAVTATGAASTNIRWIATIDTSEVVYA